jgi:hypothetical protein
MYVALRREIEVHDPNRLAFYDRLIATSIIVWGGDIISNCARTNLLKCRYPYRRAAQRKESVLATNIG